MSEVGYAGGYVFEYCLLVLRSSLRAVASPSSRSKPSPPPVRRHLSRDLHLSAQLAVCWRRRRPEADQGTARLPRLLARVQARISPYNFATGAASSTFTAPQHTPTITAAT